MDNREERIDRNQAAYEALNTRLQRIAAKLRRWRDLQVICECGERGDDARAGKSTGDHENRRDDEERSCLWGA